MNCKASLAGDQNDHITVHFASDLLVLKWHVAHLCRKKSYTEKIECTKLFNGIQLLDSREKHEVKIMKSGPQNGQLTCLFHQKLPL